MAGIWSQAILGIVIFLGAPCAAFPQAPERPLRGELLSYPGPWRFQWNARGGRAAFTTDDEFEQYVADGARGTGAFVQSLEALRAAGGDTMRIFFDYFYRQKTPGQEDAPRKYLPDSDAYIEKIAALSRVAQKYGVGFSLSFLSPSASLGYETRNWFEILNALGAYPGTGLFSGVNDNTEFLSRNSDYLVTRFPNGAVSMAPHLTRLDETWNGGGELPKSKPADFEGNPLPSGSIHLTNFKVNGHRVGYRGTGAVAFRVDDRGELVAFAGGHTSEITIDGRRTVFADRAVDEIGWAPVAEARRVPNGAVVQIMVRGSGGVRIPTAGLPPSFSLIAQGPTPGSRGADVSFRLANGAIVFEAGGELNGRWIYVVTKEAPR